MVPMDSADSASLKEYEMEIIKLREQLDDTLVAKKQEFSAHPPDYPSKKQISRGMSVDSKKK